MKTSTLAIEATRAHWAARAARVRELRSRCCTEHERFDRVTAHLQDHRLRLSRKQRRDGLLATRGVLRYRVHIRHGLKLRIIALHNSIRLSGDDGCAMPVWKLAERLSCSESQYRACFRELCDAGVFIAAKFYVDQHVVNRHDLRRGRKPRCYSRSRRPNVVTFGIVGLQLLVERRSLPAPGNARPSTSDPVGQGEAELADDHHEVHVGPARMIRIDGQRVGITQHETADPRAVGGHPEAENR